MLLMKKSFAVAFFQFYTYLERLDLLTSFFIFKNGHDIVMTVILKLNMFLEHR